MRTTVYVPVYQWSDVDPNSVNGVAYGTTIYNDLNDLYGYEPDAIGHFELQGEIPTENEFKRKHGLKSEAV
jgi:hypothetical protein